MQSKKKSKDFDPLEMLNSRNCHARTSREAFEKWVYVEDP
jgi:hypothetical protein